MKSYADKASKLSKNGSNSILMTQRSNQSLHKSSGIPSTSGTGALPALRQSFELSGKIETHNEPKVVARGLGKDKDVTVVNKTVEKNMASRAVAQTIVMRKDPSKGSLHSARENQVS